MTVSEAQPITEAEELIRLQADFSADGEFGPRELIVTRESVRVLEPGGTLAFQMPLAEIQTARNEPLVGGGRLEITAKNGDICPGRHLLADRRRQVQRGGARHRAARQRASRSPSTSKQERTRCAKCGRLLPEKDGICPACVNRSKTLLAHRPLHAALQRTAGGVWR